MGDRSLRFHLSRGSAGILRGTLPGERLPVRVEIGRAEAALPFPVQDADPPAALRYALNHEWTLPGAALRDGDEVAFVLPVSGG